MSLRSRFRRSIPIAPLVLVALTPADAAEEAPTADPPARGVADCRMDQRLAGDWSSYRPSDGGPSWLRFRFACDCTYLERAESAGSDERRVGRFHVEREALVLSSPTGTRRWPLRFHRDDLWLAEDSEGDQRRYRRTARSACAETGR